MSDATNRTGRDAKRDAPAATSTTPPAPTTPYEQTMNALRFSDSAKEALVEDVITRYTALAASPARPDLDSAPASSSRHPHPSGSGVGTGHAPLSRRAFVGIAAAATLAAAAAGAAIATSVAQVDVGEALRRLFGADPQATDPTLTSQVGSSVGVSATDNGVTIAVDSSLGDRDNAIIVFTVSRDNGQPFDELPRDAATGTPNVTLGANSTIAFADDGLPLFGNVSVEDPDPDDATFQLYYLVDTGVRDGSDPFRGRSVHAHIEDLATYVFRDPDPAGEPLPYSDFLEPVISGTWDLDFDLAYEDTSRAFETGGTFEVNGIVATVTEAYVSPLSVTVAFVARTPADADFANPLAAPPVVLGNDPLYLVMSDGTQRRMDMPEEGSGIRAGGISMQQHEDDPAVYDCKRTIQNRTLIDVDEVVAIKLGDTLEIPPAEE